VTLTVEVPDDKTDFMLELLNSISFVTVKPGKEAWVVARKAELKADLREAILELNEVLAGRKESRSVYDLLAELDAEDA
jgi:hypothetical protein